MKNMEHFYIFQLKQITACCLTQMYLSVVSPLLRTRGVVRVRLFLFRKKLNLSVTFKHLQSSG